MKTFREKTSPQDGDITGFRKCRKTAEAEALRIDEPFRVVTLEGTMYGKPGDYLMRGVEGELYPCAAAIFERTYEWVEPEREREETPESHLRSIQAMFVEFGMREPELAREDEGCARLEFRVNEDLWYRITCYTLIRGGLHTIVTCPNGTLFKGYSRVGSFAAVQNHLAKHAFAVKNALGKLPDHLKGEGTRARGTVELDPDLLSTDYGNALGPAANKLRRGPWPDLHYPKSGEDS